MLDAIDRKLLALVQADASLSVAEIAERIGLSTTPCWKRLRRLETDGYIEKRVALLNRSKIGLGVTIFVYIRIIQHDETFLAVLIDAAADMPEVIELYALSGDIDYLMKVVVPDVETYNTFYKKFFRVVKFADISSAFVLEQIKYSTEVPIAGIGPTRTTGITPGSSASAQAAPRSGAGARTR